MHYLKSVFVGIFLYSLSCTPPKRREVATFDLCKYPCDYVQRISQQLDYSLRDTGVYQHEIRFWAIYEATNLTERYVLKDVDSLTFLNAYALWEYEGSKSYQIDSLQATVRQRTTSTENLTTQLYDLGFRNMVSQPDSIRQRIGDGVTYVVELRDSTYYKLVFYNSPHLFDDENHQSFMKVLRIFEKEIDWEYEQ